MQVILRNVKMLFVLILLFFAGFTLQAQDPKTILGNWQDEAHPEKQIKMFSLSGKYFGKSIQSEPNQISIVFRDLFWSDSKNSYVGSIINPDNGDKFSVEIQMLGTDKFKFSVGKFIFTKTFTFKRIVQ